ncbi:UNVERIFIED_CONTAM: hypothetical protein FKN15_049933 [Acipenser sinensis]
MDVSVSVSLFQDELASTIEHAVKAAVDTVLCAITEAFGSKFTEFRVEMEKKEKENESLKLRLEISESELKAVLGCINAADADIKQHLIFQGSGNKKTFLRHFAKTAQEESFEQEWCASLMQVTELAFVKDEEVPQQECVPIKEEFIEQECVPIAEELPHENHVCTLEENNKLGSNLCDDSPSECELGFRDARSLLEDSEELGDDDYQASKRELVDSEVVLTQSMVVKKDALSKRHYRNYSICAYGKCESDI